MIKADIIFQFKHRSMGNQNSIDCCNAKTIVEGQCPKPLKELQLVPSLSNQQVTTLLLISNLSQIDFYIRKVKNEHIDAITSNFKTVSSFIETISVQNQSISDFPLQCKTYSPNERRFDQINNKAQLLEIGIINQNFNSLQEQQQVFYSIIQATKSNLKRVKLLRLPTNFNNYRCQQSISHVFEELNSWPTLKDMIWDIKKQSNFEEMNRHLLYNLSKFIHCLNSQISINDIFSLTQLKWIFNYFNNQIAQKQISILEEYYSCETSMQRMQSQLFQVGKIVVMHQFMQFQPQKLEDETDSDTIRNNPPKGDEQSIQNRIEVKLIITPLKHSQTPIKFRNYQFLYYLPFSLFVVQSIELKKDNLIIVYAKEMQQQHLINFIHLKNEPQKEEKLTINKHDLLVELGFLNISFTNQLTKMVKNHKGAEQFYLQYQKNIKSAQVDSIEHNEIASRKVVTIDYNLKVTSEQALTHEQIDSEPETTTLSRQNIQQYQKEVHKYIKKNNIQKLQDQLDSTNCLINITSLNISQCNIQSLEIIHYFPNIIQLFAHSNLIVNISGLQNNPQLRLLSLARNQIKKLQNLDHLVHLRELYLTKNHLEVDSAVYLSVLNPNKLRILSISFKNNADQCFQMLVKASFPRLKRMIINEGDIISHRTKNSLKRRLKGVDLQYFHS